MNDKDVNGKATQTEPAVARGRSGWRATTALVALTAAGSLLVGIVAGPIIANHRADAASTTPPAGGSPVALAADGSSSEHTITVSGSGKVSVAPDVADVYIGVSIQKPTVKDARAGAASAMTAVLASVKKNGVADKDITTTNVSLTPVYDYNSNGAAPRLVGYQWSNTVKITVRNLDKLAAVIDDSATAGATTVQGISFRLNDPKPLETQARQAAMTDARAKAEALAGSAGVTIKGVASISETSSSTPVYYNEAKYDMAAAASTPIQTGTTDVTIQVTVSYLI
jgi:uncharacterized protein YggE